MLILIFKCENGIKSDVILKIIVYCCLICYFVLSKYFELIILLMMNVFLKLIVDMKEFLKNNNLVFLGYMICFLGIFFIFLLIKSLNLVLKIILVFVRKFVKVEKF